MFKKRFLSLLVVFVFLFHFVTVPTLAAPAPSRDNHTIIVKGLGFDDTDAEFVFKLKDYDTEYTISSKDKEVHFKQLASGTYSIEGVISPDGYEVNVMPQSVRLVGRNKSETISVTLMKIPEEVVDQAITSVKSPDSIHVEFGTAVGDLGLPETVQVTLEDASTTDLNVDWDISGYDGQIAGTYTLVGDLFLVEGILNTAGHTAEVNVIVAEEEVVIVDAINYLALGDSIATGTTGISGRMYSYANGFRDYLVGQYGDGNVTYSNLAVDGDDAYDLYIKLNSNLTYINAVKNADIITLSIGGNNIMAAARADSFWSIDTTIAEVGTVSFEYYYPLIIERIRALNDDVQIIASTLYNPYNSAKQPTGYLNDTELHNLGEPFIRRINAVIKEVTDADYGIADVYTAFYGYGLNGRMGDITYFYPRYSRWTWWYVRLTRDPHPKQTGQDLIRDLHKEAFENLMSEKTLTGILVA